MKDHRGHSSDMKEVSTDLCQAIHKAKSLAFALEEISLDRIDGFTGEDQNLKREASVLAITEALSAKLTLLDASFEAFHTMAFQALETEVA